MLRLRFALRPIAFCIWTTWPGPQASADVPPRAPYGEAAAALEAMIGRELAAKRLPAVTIALVDGDAIVWARGFGRADPARSTPATAETACRVGSVSKLFTDIAAMQLVELGLLDLDAPVTRYLPEFAPADPFGKAVTTRQLMAHRSGLVREPPVGHYFDPTGPTLAATVRSLNATALIYEPGTRTKYSNAGDRGRRPADRAAPRRAVRRVDPTHGPGADGHDPFRLRGYPRDPGCLGQGPDVDPRRPDLPRPDLRDGHRPGRQPECHGVGPGPIPVALFAAGRGPGGPVLKPETLAAMYEPQFAGPGAQRASGWVSAWARWTAAAGSATTARSTGSPRSWPPCPTRSSASP